MGPPHDCVSTLFLAPLDDDPNIQTLLLLPILTYWQFIRFNNNLVSAAFTIR